MNFGHKLPKGQGLEETGLWPHSFTMCHPRTPSQLHPILLGCAMGTAHIWPPRPPACPQREGGGGANDHSIQTAPNHVQTRPRLLPCLPLPTRGITALGRYPSLPIILTRCPHAPRTVHAVSCQGSHPRHLLCLICIFMYLYIYLFYLGGVWEGSGTKACNISKKLPPFAKEGSGSADLHSFLRHEHVKFICRGKKEKKNTKLGFCDFLFVCFVFRLFFPMCLQ